MPEPAAPSESDATAYSGATTEGDHGDTDAAIRSNLILEGPPSGLTASLPALFVVIVSMAALVVSLLLILNHFPATTTASTTTGGTKTTTPAGTSTADIVAILAPVVAAITGVVATYFGLSATGSARGQTAHAAVQAARTQDKLVTLAGLAVPEDVRKTLGVK